MRTHINKYSILIISIAAALLLAACSGDDWTTIGTPQGGQPEVRPLVDHEVTVALDSGSKPQAGRPNRVAYQPEGNGLQLSWQARETLGVYIKNTNGSLIYAGTIGSTGTEGGREARRFYGKISEKLSGEQYLYLHPAPTGETKGQAAQGTINFSNQRGSLGSAAHLGGLIPLVWREGNRQPENQGYAIHLTLTMQQDPGDISAITLHTMRQGDDGTTPDRIFPKAFKAANLLNDVNSTLPSAKTSGLTLSEVDYTDAITLTPADGTTFTATREGDEWKVDAYLAAASIKNLDVFRTKFNVKIDAEHGPFYFNEYRSFPGQQTGNATDGLEMLANGKCYNISTTMSENVSYTVINDTYKVYSLLGMWNQYGKSYDPFGLIAYPGGTAEISTATIPQQLKDNKTAILSCYQNNPSGTPTWLGAGTGTLYDVTANAYSNNLRQDNVIINNIEITQPTEVFVTFISEFGWNENLLGYYHYEKNADPESSFGVRKMLIFPNFSKPNHQPFNLGGTGSGRTDAGVNIGTPAQAPLREFQTVKLLYTDENGYSSTTFPAGTIIGFMMMIDTEAQELTPNAGYNLLKWSQWRLFTNTTWNKENTKANGAAAEWPTSPGYTRWNYFCSGDVCSDAGGTRIPGLAIYGVKDTGNNDASTAYGAMIFMVSTSDPSAMETWNKAYFNIGTGNTVIEKQP